MQQSTTLQNVSYMTECNEKYCTYNNTILSQFLTVQLFSIEYDGMLNFTSEIFKVYYSYIQPGKLENLLIQNS